jgi:hypothetical protein
MNWGGNEENLKLDESCISNSKSEISNRTLQPTVRFAISDFGFEMQDSSNFKFLLLFIILSLSVPLNAQQRPLITEDPRLIPDGAMVMESGLGYAHKAEFPLSGLTGEEISIVNGINFGLGPRAEFQMNGVLQSFVKVGEKWRNDWGDSSISTKIRIVPETSILPIISFRPTVTLPNSNDSRGIGTNSMNFFGNLLIGKSAGRGFIYGNVGLGILTDTLLVREQQDILTFGLAGVLPVNSRISLVSEWNGWNNPRGNPSPGTESRSQIRLGMQIRTGTIRWDVAGTAGVTSLDPRGGVVFGMTKEFRLWK